MIIALPKQLDERRQYSDERLETLIGELKSCGATKLTGRTASVYTTGSVARGEASPHSDLDLFIVARSKSFGRQMQLRLKSRLIEASSAAGFPEFSGDGEYLDVHLAKDLADQIGSRDEDMRNLLTARLLLLLESRPVIGQATYHATIERVIESYWRDYDDHGTNFMPIFLMNDIIRFWKVLCLNYEARTYDSRSNEFGKRRLMNYKLKFSRMLTCYSALAFLCHVSRSRDTVTCDDMLDISSMTPLERVARLGQERKSVRSLTDSLLTQYAVFLETSASPKDELRARFNNSAFHEARRDEAQRFGDTVFQLIQKLASGTPLLRYIVV